MPYTAPPGIGDPAATRATAAALRHRARVLEDILHLMQAAHDSVDFQGPGADRFRVNLRSALPALRHEANRCLEHAARLDGAAQNAQAMIARERRERLAEARQRGW